MPVTKLLIANRGEIAIRIARAAADMGIPTVAVCSSDDTTCLHVRVADACVTLPGAGAAGYQDAWGVGRHLYGSNYFHYVRDPWMGLHEFFWDIDFIPENGAWEVEIAEASPDALCQWATTPPPDDFLRNYERRDAA